MKVDLEKFVTSIEEYIQLAEKKPIIIEKGEKPQSVLISYNIYKTLLEGAWAESALKYSGEKKTTTDRLNSKPKS